MRKVTVVSNAKVEVKPFVLEDFTVQKKRQSTTLQQVSKKELKSLAKELGLDFDAQRIDFSKKLINEYIKRSI